MEKNTSAPTSVSKVSEMLENPWRNRIHLEKTIWKQRMCHASIGHKKGSITSAVLISVSFFWFTQYILIFIQKNNFDISNKACFEKIVINSKPNWSSWLMTCTSHIRPWKIKGLWTQKSPNWNPENHLIWVPAVNCSRVSFQTLVSHHSAKGFVEQCFVRKKKHSLGWKKWCRNCPCLKVSLC